MNDNDYPSLFERALNIVKNLIVILTCGVILFLIFRAYMALEQWQRELSQLPFGG